MSQAVFAPSTGARVFTGGKSVPSTDISDTIAGSASRRSVLAGMMLGPAAVALPLAAQATEGSGWEHPIDKTERVDAAFWAALRAWRKVDRGWSAAMQADPNMSDPAMNAWGEQESAAEWAMLSTPIRTMRAMAAKLEHVRGQELEVFAMREGGMICIMDLLNQDAHRMLFRDYVK